MGFEPTRAEHIGLAVQRLNHSATSSAVFSQIYVVKLCLKHNWILTTVAGSVDSDSLALYDEIWAGRGCAPKVSKTVPIRPSKFYLVVE